MSRDKVLSIDWTPVEERKCPVCGEPLPEAKMRNARSRFCSLSCRRASQREQKREANGGAYDLPSGTVGAMHEMVVAADLMKRGYHVFRSLSPACPCDLMVFKELPLYIRVEVRTADRRWQDRSIIFKINDPRDEGRQDVFAFVTHDGEICYVPDILN